MFETDLFPVQVLFLMKPKKLKVHEAFYAILQSLVLRQIIRINKINSFPADRSKRTQKYLMLRKGEIYDTYPPQSFEESFVFPFVESPQIQIKKLTNYVIKQYGLASKFISNEIFKPLSDDGFASAVPLMKGFGFFKTNKKGKEIAQMAEMVYSQQEEKLRGLIDGDWQQFVDCMNETDFFVFLIKERNPDLYKQILSMVKRLYRMQPIGPENDLTNFYEAMTIDLDYFLE